jgi:hypothetical protein
MQKKQSKKNIKATRKSIKVQIQENLIANLIALTSENGKANHKLAKTIKKGSAKLAEKISGLIKVDRNIGLATSNKPTTVTVEETVVLAEAKPAKATPASPTIKPKTAIKAKPVEKIADK